MQGPAAQPVARLACPAVLSLVHPPRGAAWHSAGGADILSAVAELDAYAVRELVRGIIGGDRWRVVPFGAGKFSQAFGVLSVEGEFVLRVAPPDDVRQLFYEYRMMRQEPAIHQRLLAETSVPVPEIVAHDFSRERIDRAHRDLRDQG